MTKTRFIGHTLLLVFVLLVAQIDSSSAKAQRPNGTKNATVVEPGKTIERQASRTGRIASGFSSGYPGSILAKVQSRPQVTRAAARKFFDEAERLREEGSASSLEKAIVEFERAFEIYKTLGDGRGEARSLNSLGNVHNLLANHRKALELYDRALPICIAAGYRSGEATTLDGLGLTYYDLGQKERALEFFNRALRLRIAVRDRRGEATTLDHLGYTYSSLGEKPKALELYRQALPIFKAAHDLSGQAITLNYIGRIHDDSNEKQEALDFLNQALELFRETHDRRGKATVLSNLGLVYASINRPQKALELYNQALAQRRQVGDLKGEAATIQNIGRVYHSIESWREALESYNEALQVFRLASDDTGEAVTLYILMNLLRSRNPGLAILYGKQAINILQQLRANISGLDQGIQRSFLQSRVNIYRDLVDVLISQGRLPEAEQVLALLKDEEFSSLRSRGDPKGAVGYSPAEAEAVKALDQIGDLGREANELRHHRENKVLDAKGQQRLDQIERELLPQANAKFRLALAAIEKEAPATVIKTAEVEGAQSLMRYLREMGSGTVALYTVVSTESGKSSKGWVILVTPNFRKAYELDVADLDQTVAALRQTLRSDTYDPQPLARKLYGMIFLKPQKEGKTLAADLEDYLRDQKEKTLMWSLDGVLRYVPMAALHDSERYLVERYRNVVFTPASLPGLTHATSREWNALGLGVAKKYEGFTALSGVPKELSAIVRDAQKHTSGVLPGTIKWDDEFKEKAMMDSLSEGYNVVHIASHFSYQAANPEKSFLLLGDGGHLEMSKIQDLSTLFEKTDLVTLSACDTAVGSAMKDANGKDVEGFAYVTQKLGAMAVIASLWPVDDVGTQVLMPKFYDLHQSGLSKGEALRQAQLSLLSGDVQQTASEKNSKRAELVGQTRPAGSSAQPLFKSDPKAPFAHPYYWAPFILIGNWK